MEFETWPKACYPDWYFPYFASERFENTWNNWYLKWVMTTFALVSIITSVSQCFSTPITYVVQIASLNKQPSKPCWTRNSGTDCTSVLTVTSKSGVATCYLDVKCVTHLCHLLWTLMAALKFNNAQPWTGFPSVYEARKFRQGLEKCYHWQTTAL